MADHSAAMAWRRFQPCLGSKSTPKHPPPPAYCSAARPPYHPSCRFRPVGPLRTAFPWLHHIFADSAYSSRKLKGALEKLGEWTIEIVNRCNAAKGFVLLPLSEPSA